MPSLHERQWIIEVNQQEAGPFTLDELKSLLKEKQILSQYRARSRLDAASGWRTIETLLAQSQEFIPPKRPTNSNESITRISTAQPGIMNDAAENLFEALQLAKEKQHPSLTPGRKKTPSNPTRFRWGTPIIAMVSVLCVAFAFTLWSAIQVFTLSSGRTISSEEGAAPKKDPELKTTHPAEFTIGNPPQSKPAESKPNRRLVRKSENPAPAERSKPARLLPAAQNVPQSTVEEIPAQEVVEGESTLSGNEEKRMNPSAKAAGAMQGNPDESFDGGDQAEGDVEESAETRMANDFQN